jgi:hypothetical protein
LVIGFRGRVALGRPKERVCALRSSVCHWLNPDNALIRKAGGLDHSKRCGICIRIWVRKSREFSRRTNKIDPCSDRATSAGSASIFFHLPKESIACRPQLSDALQSGKPNLFGVVRHFEYGKKLLDTHTHTHTGDTFLRH